MKRLLGRLLLVVSIVALVMTPALAGASYLNTEGEFPIVNETVTVTGFGSHSTGNADWNDMIILKLYEEMTGIDVEWQTVQAHAYPEQLTIRMASNDIPDVFLRAKIGPELQVRYGSQGLLRDLNDFEEYMPNFFGLMEQYPEIRSTITAPDGGIYALPLVNVSDFSRYNNYKLYMNKEWLDAVGMPIPTTTEEYYQTLKAFVEKDANGNGEADEIGWTGDTSFKLIKYLMGSWGLLNRGNTNVSFGSSVSYDVDPETGELRYVYDTPQYKEILEYVNMLYTEGLIDQEIFTIQSQSANNPAKAAEDKIGSCLINKETDIGADLAGKWVFVPQLTGPYGDHINVNVNCMAETGQAGIGRDCEYPEAVARMFDYFYSEEGAVFIWGGIEGETYFINDNGKVERTEAIVTQELSMADYSPAANGQFPYAVYEIFANPTEAYAKTLEQVKLDEPEEIWAPFMLTEEEQAIVDSLEFSPYLNEMQAKFIAGTESFDGWDQFIAQMERLGVTEYMDILNAAYQRTVAK